MQFSALRKAMVTLMLFVVVLPATLFAGYVSTTRLIPDVKPGLLGDDENIRAAAHRALILADIGCVEGLGSIFGLKLQLIDIHLDPGYCPRPLDTERAFRARVRSYSLFMFPTGTISVDSCGPIRCGFG